MEFLDCYAYRDFLNKNDAVKIGDCTVRLRKQQRACRFEPENYLPEEWTIWSFPERGSWATHTGDYPGNWSPFVPRNLLDRYTRANETVCDPMAGSGTTLVECKLLGRNAIGVDINLEACMIAMNRLDFDFESDRSRVEGSTVEVYCGDARNLDAVSDEKVELVTLHPPYAGLIRYSKEGTSGDLSHLGIKEFVHEIRTVAEECFRILKQGRYCAVLIGDTRIRGHYVPLNVGVLSAFLTAGFVLKEDIIKVQHQTRSAREQWADGLYDFYKIAHEHLYVLRKPASGERVADFEHSLRWW